MIQERKLRFGLLGFSQGFYATTYTRHLAKLKEVEVVACCDMGQSPEYVQECAGMTASQFSEEIGCRLVRHPEELFALGVDMVMVACEVWEHAKYAEMALKHGCHVFVGKPLSLEPDEIQSLIQSAEAANRVVLPGNPLRYEGAVQSIAARVHQGEIGRPTNLRLFIHHEAMIHQEWERDPARSGGPLGTFGVYLMDTVKWITGEDLTEIYATGGQFVFPQIQSWDTVQAIGKTSGGTLVQLNLVSSMDWDFPFYMLDVVGTKGIIRTDHDRYSYILQNPRAELGPIRYDPMGSLEIEHFLNCCAGREKPCMTLEDMLHAARGIKAIEQSIRTGLAVSF